MPPPADPVPARIFTIRGVRVILDTGLARLYGVSTKRFNEAFKRNRHRFPEDFAFQLTPEKADNLRSQSVTSSQGHGGRRYSPWVFTEHGALMAANLLRSERAVEMSVYVVRAFVKQREMLTSNAVILKLLADEVRQHGDGVVKHSRTARAALARVQLCRCPLRAA